MRLSRWLAFALMLTACTAPTSDNVFQLWRAQNDDVALSVSILQDRRLVYTYAAGTDAAQPPMLVRSTTPFEVGSVTKSITARLVEDVAMEHRIRLTDPIGGLLSASCPNKITLSDLLTQTSILGDVPRSDRRMSEQAVVDIACRTKRRFLHDWSYKNSNYIAAGLVAEKLSGKSLGELFDKRFVRRLRLSSAAGYKDRTESNIATGSSVSPERKSAELKNAYGAGALIASSNDLAVIGADLLRFLPPATSTGWKTIGENVRYGYGFYRYTEGPEDILIHDGRIDGTSAALVLLPRKGRVIALLSPGEVELSGLGIQLAQRRW